MVSTMRAISPFHAAVTQTRVRHLSLLVTEPAMNELEELKIITEITKLKARYCRLVDIKDWGGFESLFAEDATFDIPGMGGMPIKGRREILALVRKSIGEGNSIHIVSMPDIDVLDADMAKATWGLETVLSVRARPGEPAPRSHAFTHDTYARRDGSWLLQSVRLEPLARLR